MEEQLTIAPLPCAVHLAHFMFHAAPDAPQIDVGDACRPHRPRSGNGEAAPGGPNNFVNLCVERVLDAMDAPRSDDIPSLSLHNQVEGKTFLTSTQGYVGALAPEVYDRRPGTELSDGACQQARGRLTAEVFKGYRKLAQRMN